MCDSIPFLTNFTVPSFSIVSKRFIAFFIQRVTIKMWRAMRPLNLIKLRFCIACCSSTRLDHTMQIFVWLPALEGINKTPPRLSFLGVLCLLPWYSKEPAPYTPRQMQKTEILSAFFTLVRLVLGNPRSLRPRVMAGARKTYCCGAS